jgi:hypothetical protein
VTVSGGGITPGASPSLATNAGALYLVVPDQPPVIANIVTNNVTTGLSWKIAITNLAATAGWSDPDPGDMVGLSSVGPTSANGVSLTSDAINIYYNGAVTSPDHFGYTVTDGTLTANGTVYLQPVGTTAPSLSNPSTTGAGNPTFSGFGISGYVYGVESTTNLPGPWIEAGNTTAGADGSWTFTDLNQTNPPSIFYRLYYPDNPANPPQ